MKTITTNQARQEILGLLENNPYRFNNIEDLREHLCDEHEELLSLHKCCKSLKSRLGEKVYYKQLLHNAKLIRVTREMINETV